MPKRRRRNREEEFSFKQEFRSCLIQAWGLIGFFGPLGLFLLALVNGWWSREDRVYLAIAAGLLLFVGLPWVIYVIRSDDDEGTPI